MTAAIALQISDSGFVLLFLGYYELLLCLFFAVASIISII